MQSSAFHVPTNSASLCHPLTKLTGENSHWWDLSPLRGRSQSYARQLSMTPPNFSLDLIVSEARTVLSLKDDDRKPWRAGTEEYPSTLSTKITGGKPRSLCTQMTHREAKRISALVHQRRSHRENMKAPLGSISYPRLPGTTTKNPLKIKKK